MSLRFEWPCWEIMKCTESQKCPTRENAAKFCYEMIEEHDRYSFNICRDCLVYIVKQENPKFSKEELLSIMAQKGVSVFEQKNCPLFGGFSKK